MDGEHRAMEDAFAAAPQHAAGGGRRQTKQLSLGRLSCVHGVPARLGDDRFREKKAPNSLFTLALLRDSTASNTRREEKHALTLQSRRSDPSFFFFFFVRAQPVIPGSYRRL